MGACEAWAGVMAVAGRSFLMPRCMVIVRRVERGRSGARVGRLRDGDVHTKQRSACKTARIASKSSPMCMPDDAHQRKLPRPIL